MFGIPDKTMSYKIKCGQFLFIVTVAYSIFLLQSCNNKASTKDAAFKKVEKQSTASPVIPLKMYNELTYHVDSIKDKTSLALYDSMYTSEEKDIIAALNRIDKNRIGVGKKIILPDTFYHQLLEYAPFPFKLEIADSIDKLIIVSIRTQAFGIYEYGKLIRWGPVSTGRKAKPTPAKLYYTNYKARLKISTVNEEWEMPWYFNIDNMNGIGLHQFTLPGYPASHSCVRMYEADAYWIYHWAKQWVLSGDVLISHGTLVIIYGSYDFDLLSPWKRLAEDHLIMRLTTAELEEIHAQIMKIR